MNLLQLLLGSMTSSNSVNSVAKKTGANSGLVSKLMLLAIPMLIKYLTKNASTKAGQQSLLGALTQHKDTDTLANQIGKADEDDGAKIINHILGKDKDSVVAQLVGETGMSTSQVNQTLSAIAPSLLSGLSAATTQAQTSNSNDLSGLLNMFGGSQSTSNDALGALTSLLGASNSKPAANANPLGALTSLLGGSSKPAANANPMNAMLGSLLGGSNKQDTSAFDGSQLLSLLTQLK